MLGHFSLSSADFFQNQFFHKFFKNTIKLSVSLSNCLDPDQDRHSVGPDLGLNCLQRLSAEEPLLARKELRKKYKVYRLSPNKTKIVLRKVIKNSLTLKF